MVTQPATAAGVRLVQGHIAAASGEAAHPSSSTLSASSSLVRSASVSTSARIPSSVSKMAFCCSETVFKTSSSEEKLMSELIGPARGHHTHKLLHARRRWINRPPLQREKFA